MTTTYKQKFNEAAYISAFSASGGTELIGDYEITKFFPQTGVQPPKGELVEFTTVLNGKDNWITPISLISPVSAVTKTGGTFAALCNPFAFSQFESIECYHNRTLISHYEPDYLYNRYNHY